MQEVHAWRHTLVASIVSTRVSREEETAFSRTLMKGIAHFQKRIASLENGSNTLSGEDAFQLYDTYGFPLDLTQASPRLQHALAGSHLAQNMQACLLLLAASQRIGASQSQLLTGDTWVPCSKRLIL